MSLILQLGDRTIAPAEIILMLANYQMLPQLRRELLVDKAIASLQLSTAESAIAIEQYYKKYQITTPAECQAFLQHYGLSASQLEALAIRESKIEKFKLITWEHKLESFFLAHKSKLDKVIYSVLRTHEPELAQELYFARYLCQILELEIHAISHTNPAAYPAMISVGQCTPKYNRLKPIAVINKVVKLIIPTCWRR